MKAAGKPPVTEKGKADASPRKIWWRNSNIGFAALLGLCLVGLLLLGPLIQSRVTTVVAAETPFVEWTYDGDDGLVVDLPDGDDLAFALDPETGEVLKSTSTPLVAPSLELSPGTRVRIVHTQPCQYEFYTAMSERAGAAQPRLIARGVQERILDGDEGLPVFRYAPKVCGQPIELSIERATRLTMGNLRARRIGPGLYGQTVASGRVEIFNTAWGFGGRYKMSETELGSGDTVLLAALPGQTALTSKWNGHINLGRDSDGLMMVKVSSLQNKVVVQKYVGDYVVDTNPWQSLYTQPIVQFAIVIIGFLVGLYGVFRQWFSDAP